MALTPSFPVSAFLDPIGVSLCSLFPNIFDSLFPLSIFPSYSLNPVLKLLLQSILILLHQAKNKEYRTIISIIVSVIYF